MKPGEPLSEVTYERAGASFLCVDVGTGKGQCDVTLYARLREPRGLAGELLEEMTELSRALRDLPPEYPIPEGVRTSVDAAYEASVAWVELLDRKAGARP